MKINQIKLYNLSRNQQNFQGDLIINNRKTGQVIKKTFGDDIDNLVYNAFCDYLIPLDFKNICVHNIECRRYNIIKFFNKIAEISGLGDTKKIIFGKERKRLDVRETYSSCSITDNENFNISLNKIDPRKLKRII